MREIELDLRLTQWAERGEPGCAVGVIEDGELVLERDFGVEDLVGRRAISGDSRFDIASEAKQFTGACVVLLERERKIGMADEIGGVLPELPEALRRVRVEQLLHHTGGVPDFFARLRERNSDLHRACVLRDVYELICESKAMEFSGARAVPGARFQYSNSGYALAAVMVERIEGKSFGAILSERIFGPLGMGDTFMHDTPGAPYERHAKGHVYDGTSGYRECWYPAFAVGGAGCLYSSVKDLARWVNGLHGGALGGMELPARMREPGRLNDGSKTKYGLGLDWGQCFLAPEEVAIVTHGGTHGGSGAILLHAPEERFSIVLLCNNRRIDHGGIAMEMARRMAAERRKAN